MTITGSSAFSSSINKCRTSTKQQPQQEVSIKDHSTLGSVITEVVVHNGIFKLSEGVDCLHSKELEKVINKLNFLLSPDFILIPGKLIIADKSFTVESKESYQVAVCHLINQYICNPGFNVCLIVSNRHLSSKILSCREITDLLVNFFDRRCL